MKKSRKFVLALTGLAALCVCAAMAAPLATGDAGMMKNGTGMQGFIETMQANGVETTTLETALENGDEEAVRAFMEANRPEDAPEGKHTMNEERMQQMIQRMQANGVDTTELEAALENGDEEAVHAFMEANRPDDAGTGYRRGSASTE